MFRLGVWTNYRLSELKLAAENVHWTGRICSNVLMNCIAITAVNYMVFHNFEMCVNCVADILANSLFYGTPYS